MMMNDNGIVTAAIVKNKKYVPSKTEKGSKDIIGVSATGGGEGGEVKIKKRVKKKALRPIMMAGETGISAESLAFANLESKTKPASPLFGRDGPGPGKAW